MIGSPDINIKVVHYGYCTRRSVQSPKQNAINAGQKRYFSHHPESLRLHLPESPLTRSVYHTHRTLNHSYQGYNPQKVQKIYEIGSPCLSRNTQKPNKYIRNPKITFTYSSPNSSNVFNYPITPTRPRDASPNQRLTQSFKQTSHSQLSPTKDNRQNNLKFAFTTQSTLITLKDTKKDMNIFDGTIEEQQSQSNHLQSEKGRKSMMSNIENELDNLFENEQKKDNEEQFKIREYQFEEVLFS